MIKSRPPPSPLDVAIHAMFEARDHIKGLIYTVVPDTLVLSLTVAEDEVSVTGTYINLQGETEVRVLTMRSA
jgi:hypothetical protein